MYNITEQDVLQSTTFDADVVIVGSGPGGATVAQHALKHGHSVIMLEDGQHHPEQDVNTASAVFHKMWRGSGLTAGLGKPPLAYAEGVCLGGGSEINSAIYQMPYEQTIKGWVNDFHLDDSWQYHALKPYYHAVFQDMNVTETHPHFEDTDILFRGAKANGFKCEHLPRAMDAQSKLPPRTYGCPTRGKQTMSRTLLPKAFKQGLICITNAWAKKIIVNRGTAQSIQFMYNGKIKRTVRFKKIFICAGAIQTPALLQRSGIRHNIGTTLQMHPTIKMVGRFDQIVQTGQSTVPTAAVTEFLPDIRIGGSVYDAGFFAMGIANNYDNTHVLLEKPNHLGSYYTMIKPQGYGRVFALPFIKEPFVKYTLTPRDFKNLQMGMGYACQVMFSAGANLIFPDIAGHTGWSSMTHCETDLQTPIKPQNFNVMSIHLMASCRPGGIQKTSATNPHGQIWELSNAYICDASQIPTALGVNPQASLMAIANHHCDIIFNV